MSTVANVVYWIGAGAVIGSFAVWLVGSFVIAAVETYYESSRQAERRGRNPRLAGWLNVVGVTLFGLLLCCAAFAVLVSIASVVAG